MVRPIPTISPSQLLALKALDPLQQQEEHGEHQDGQPDISQILHKRLLQAHEYRPSKQACMRGIPFSNGVHAAQVGSLTKSMQRDWRSPTKSSSRPEAESHSWFSE